MNKYFNKTKILIYFIFLFVLLNNFNNLFDFNPFLSIIIPIYNNEKFLPFCLNSIINQTIKNIEIICIDDGSTDNSIKILKKYKEKDHRLIIELALFSKIILTLLKVQSDIISIYVNYYFSEK